MDFLGQFAGNNGIPVLVFATMLVCIIILAVKKGLISVKTESIRVGQDNDTRQLIQAQWEFTEAKMESVIGFLPERLNPIHTKYVISKASDVIQKAIIFNNMSNREPYIRAKQELVYATVMKRVSDPYFKTPEFKEWCFEFVKNLIVELVEIKNLYTSNSRR